MAEAPSQVSLNGSRLVRFLTDLAVTDSELSHKQFAERLGQLFGLPDSIAISAVHSRLPKMAFEPSGQSSQEIRDEFLRLRGSIVQSAIRSFLAGDTSTRTRYPEINANATVGEDTEFEPYLAFYLARQRDIDAKIRSLRTGVRESVSGFSPALAKLAALDSALGDPIAAHTRRIFAVVPKLLQKRFEFLLEQYRQANGAQQQDQDLWNKTHAQFRSDMQGLLLAEIDARLLPALGLIEALDEHEES